MFVHRKSTVNSVFWGRGVLYRLENERTVVWKKKEKRTHRGQKWVGRDEKVS